MKIRTDDFYKAIGAELEEYSAEVSEAVKETVKAEARACKKEIVERSPVRFGHYKKGWRVSTLYDGPGGVRVSVNNKEYQLTHLLENGHANVKGGRVDGIPHIAPAAERVRRELPEKLRKAIGETG